MTSKKVLVLFGSPRKKGSLRYLCDQLLEHKGYDGEYVFLNELNFRGCQSCFYCRTHENCVLKDELTPIYDKIAAAEKLIIASPIFYGTLSGQLKCAMDRCFAFTDIELNKEGKNTYGSKLEKTRDVFFLVSHGNSIPAIIEGMERPIRYLCTEIMVVIKAW